MGEIVQHPDQEARAEVARLDAAIRTAREAGMNRHYRVCRCRRRGWVSGSDSLINSLLTETGLRNASGDLGVASGGFVSLEAIVNLKPGFHPGVGGR